MLNGRRAYRSVRAALSAAERGAVHRALASLRSGSWSLSFELACTLEAVNPPRPVGLVQEQKRTRHFCHRDRFYPQLLAPSIENLDSTEVSAKAEY